MFRVRHALLLAAACLAAGPAFAQGKVRGITKAEIVLGMHTDLSGPVAAFGVSSRNGALMRVEEVNEAGGVHGRKLRLIAEDHQYQVPRAVQAVNKLLNRDHVFAMIGALGTPMNNAVMQDQIKAGVPNLFPLTAARQMHEPFHRLKFAGASSYYDQIRSGIKYLVETKGKKSVCALYQDTDFGQEVFEGVRDQLAAMNMKLVETATNRPTDTDLTAQIVKLRNAKCDLIGLGTIVRDSIYAYATARKMGWTDVDFVGQAASYHEAIAQQPGGITNGFYTTTGIVMPSRDSAPPTVVAWLDRYQERFNTEPTVGALYGYTYMDQVIIGLDRAGPNPTLDSFIKGMESIQGYRDLFGSPTAGYGPNKRQGSNSSFLLVVQDGKFVPLTEPISY